MVDIPPSFGILRNTAAAWREWIIPAGRRMLGVLSPPQTFRWSARANRRERIREEG